MRFDIDGWAIAYAHPEWSCYRVVRAWVHQYPNGWERRTMMDKEGRAVYTNWIRPKGAP